MGPEPLSFQLSLGGESLFLRLPKHAPKAFSSWSERRHCHAEYELHVILRGSCALEVNDRAYTLRENDAVLILPGQYHLAQNAPGEFERFNASFSVSTGFLSQALQSGIRGCAFFRADAELRRLCESVEKERGQQSPYRGELLHAQLSELLVRVWRLLGLRAQDTQGGGDAEEDVRNSKIDTFFEQHYMDPSGEKLLAEELHLSRRQLARVLQKNYALGFRQKLINTRMDHAAWLLRSTEMQVSEISSAVGYSSEATFFRLFKSRFQMTPRQYRLWAANGGIG